MSDDRIDLDLIARHIREAGFPAIVDMTGGGTATVCVGDLAEDEVGDLRYVVTCGPGQFDGPGYTNAFAWDVELGWGWDDGGLSPETYAFEEGMTEADVAASIVAMMRRAK